MSVRVCVYRYEEEELSVVRGVCTFSVGVPTEEIP